MLLQPLPQRARADAQHCTSQRAACPLTPIMYASHQRCDPPAPATAVTQPVEPNMAVQASPQCHQQAEPGGGLHELHLQCVALCGPHLQIPGALSSPVPAWRQWCVPSCGKPLTDTNSDSVGHSALRQACRLQAGTWLHCRHMSV